MFPSTSARPAPSSELTLPIGRLRDRQTSKWQRYGAEVIPAWVAEMDFQPPPAVQGAMERLVASGEYGYPLRNKDRADLMVSQAFARRMQSRFGWKTEPDLVQPLADLVQATFACVMAFSEPGDGVILQIPAYPPFRDAIADTGRRLISHQVRYEGDRISLNVESLASLVDDRTRIILLCNPHNPSGRVYRREELEAISKIAIAHELIVVSDEIHCDLIYSGGPGHIPFASLGPDVAARTVTLNSATKSFNIPGVRCAVIHFGTKALRERFFARFPRRVLGAPSSFGIDATVAAWDDDQPWLDNVLRHLRDVRDHVATVIKTEMPQLTFFVPEATYLGWIDCSKLGLSTTAFDFFYKQAKVAFNAGETFDPLCPAFVRFNFATSKEVASEILERMAGALRQNRR